MNSTFIRNSQKLLELWSDFISLFFPTLCYSCGERLFKNENSICTHCQYHLPKTDFHLSNDNPVAKIFWGRINLAAATAYFFFNKGGHVQQLIHQLKYKGVKHLAFDIGKLYGNELKNASHFKDIDLIIPVPLHKKRQRKRGYNQSAYFAEGLSSSMHTAMDTTILFRTFASETQTKKSRFTRWKNVENIFYTKNEQLIFNKHILLVDDVVTTGATLEACAQALLKIEGVRISIATIAFASN
ncbi:MAG TPA: ComF family protein [Bacteroidia bacterium]|jgi:ComF family protein|nr:ComF family protein [Bacteroidia bacterium]HRG52297.1 ComF family protein [Bacteroidia bacterium]